MIQPDEFALRVVDMPLYTKAFVTFDADGFPSVYVNARLSKAAQAEALDHELRHIARGDIDSPADIRAVEGARPQPEVAASTAIRALDGTPLPGAPGFDAALLTPIGAGLYRPVGVEAERCALQINALLPALEAACRRYDVLSGGPAVDAARLRASVGGGVAPESVAFVAFPPAGPDGAPPPHTAVVHFRQGAVSGTVYRVGSDAVRATVRVADRVTVCLDMASGAPRCTAVYREVDGGALRLC